MRVSIIRIPMVIFLSVLLLAGCTANLNEYQDTQPAFEMDTFFSGQLMAYGMVQDRSGKVIRRFTAELVGQWQGDRGVLEEDFIYDDGETQRRVWHLEKLADGNYRGTANDVIDSALGGSQGYAFNWRYSLEINVDGRKWAIDLNDWIYQLDESRVINRTEMTKWGFKVGEITLVIEKISG